MEKGDNEQVKTKRELIGERLKERYPDKDFADDEALFGQISDDYDEYDKELGGYRDHEKAFSDMFTSDPRSAAFLTDWRKGEDPTIGLIRRFGPEIKDAIDDPELQEQIAKANKEYVERVQKSKELEEEYQKNISETLQYLDGLAKNGEMQEKDIDDAMELLISIVHDGIVGKFSPETIAMAVKALNHDADVEEASVVGEVRGRNAKIDERLRRSEKGDGMPVLNGKNGSVGNRRARSIFDEARGASV